MKLEYLPGWVLMLLLTVLATSVSQLVELGGKHPVEASALVVVLGIAVRNGISLNELFLPGIKAGEKLLVLGIVLMGASLDYSKMLDHGANILAVIALTMVSGFFLICLLSRWANLSQKLGLLLAVGTTICGGTAVAVTAPLIEAKEEETSYAVATIALWGVVAILLYPALARMVGASDFHFGVFAGTAIHSTPQVVGAGFIFSETAGKTATAIKLIRNCFMAPLALIIAVWYTRRGLTSGMSMSGERAPAAVTRAFPWFLFAFFLMSWFCTRGYFTPVGVSAFTDIGKFLINLGMAGVGLNTSLAAFRSVGSKPLLIGLLGAVLVAFLSVLSIHFIL